MISHRARRIRPSGIRIMVERAARMVDPINFGIGQPHFDAPEPVKQAAIEAIRRGDNGYTGTRGLPELNERLASTLESRWGRRPEATLITSGVTGGLMLSYLALLDAGDEILLPDPYFPVYRELAEALNLRFATYDLHPEFRLTRQALEKGCSERTKVLLLNSPANPTGVVMTAEEIDVAVAFARERGLAVISDEIYDAFTYDEPHETPATRHEETLVLGGFSKTYGVPGWRLGFAAGPAELIEAMAKLQMFSYVCANAPGQHAALAAFDVDVTPYVSDYKRRRDRLCDALSERYRMVRPGGAFYLYPEVPDGEDAAAFVDRACDRGVVVVPGDAFSARSSHFRISYAVEHAQLDEGIVRLLDLVSG